MSYGRTTVVIDEGWRDHTAIEVDEAVRTFSSFVKAKSLSTEVHTSYGPGIDRQQANAVLGFTAAETPLRWAGKPDSGFYSIEELPELRVGCLLIDWQ